MNNISKQTVVLVSIVVTSMILIGCVEKTVPNNVQNNTKNSSYTIADYSNENIGVNLRHPSNWVVYDNQEKIDAAGLESLRMDIENVFILIITPSTSIPKQYEFEKVKEPIITLQIIPFPVTRDKLPRHLLRDSLNQEITVMKQEDSTASITNSLQSKIINGVEWSTYSAAMTANNIYVNNFSYIDTDGKWYKFSILCKLDTVEGNKKYFDQIMESVKLAKK